MKSHCAYLNLSFILDILNLSFFRIFFYFIEMVQNLDMDMKNMDKNMDMIWKG